MKIAIVAPSPVPFAPGGAEAVWVGLHRELHLSTPHDVELVKIPIRETALPEVMAAYEAFSRLDLSHFDLVISGKYPAWMVTHPRHVVYMLHPLRGLYDSYDLFGQPEYETSNRPSVRRLLSAVARLAAGLPVAELFESWRATLADIGTDAPELRFPGPLARTMVHGLDRQALRPGAVSRHLAISQTVARRTSYFPPEATVSVVHPPSDLLGLHEEPGRYFFTASRHDAAKRLDLLVEGMKRYRGELPLLIAGTGPETARLQQLATDEPRIQWVGRLEPDELVSHYARAVGVAFVPFDEDLGLITHEALASGKPVLTTTDSGGPLEFVVPGSNGVVVEPDAESLGRGLAELERLAAQPHVADAARRSVSRNTWGRVVRELLRPEGTGLLGRSTGRPRLVVTSTFPIWPPRGGGQIRAYHLYGALCDKFDIEILCLGTPTVQASVRQLRPGFVERVIPRSAEHQAAETAVTIEVGMPVSDIVAGQLVTRTPAYLDALAKALRGAAGVVLADPFLHPAVQLQGTRVPVVYDAYNCELVLKSQLLPDTPVGDRLRQQVHAVEEAACAEAVQVWTVSDEDRENLQTFYGTPQDRFLPVPNGVDLDAVPFTALDQRHTRRDRWLTSMRDGGNLPGVTSLALFLGSWHLPNNEAAEEILQLAPGLPTTGFLLVGSHCGALLGLHVPPNVLLLGEVSDAVKRVLLASVDLALAPLKSGSGTNLKVVEYLAAGAPVVTTLIGLRGLAVEPAHVRVATVSAFAEAIRAELADAKGARSRTAAARRAVEQTYDWGAIGRRVLPSLVAVLDVPEHGHRREDRLKPPIRA